MAIPAAVMAVVVASPCSSMLFVVFFGGGGERIKVRSGNYSHVCVCVCVCVTCAQQEQWPPIDLFILVNQATKEGRGPELSRFDH